jgi:hypothetical protein
MFGRLPSWRRGSAGDGVDGMEDGANGAAESLWFVDAHVYEMVLGEEGKGALAVLIVHPPLLSELHADPPIL